MCLLVVVFMSLLVCVCVRVRVCAFFLCAWRLRTMQELAAQPADASEVCFPARKANSDPHRCFPRMGHLWNPDTVMGVPYTNYLDWSTCVLCVVCKSGNHGMTRGSVFQCRQ